MGILPLARLRLRAVMHDFAAVCKTPRDYNRHMVLSDQARQQVNAWARLEDNLCLPISNREITTETVDTEGYGWYWRNKFTSGEIPEDWRGSHINVLELWCL